MSNNINYILDNAQTQDPDFKYCFSYSAMLSINPGVLQLQGKFFLYHWSIPWPLSSVLILISAMPDGKILEIHQLCLYLTILYYEFKIALSTAEYGCQNVLGRCLSCIYISIIITSFSHELLEVFMFGNQNSIVVQRSRTGDCNGYRDSPALSDEKKSVSLEILQNKALSSCLRVDISGCTESEFLKLWNTNVTIQ